MFRIRRIYDDVLPVNRVALAEVRRIMREQFSSVPDAEIDGLGARLADPFMLRFRTVLLVAERARRSIAGFAIVLHDPALGFCYLDYIATAKFSTSGGVGGALYEAVREEARALGAKGLFFECLPDEPYDGGAPDELEQNRARLRFYERYGARPLAQNDYARALKPGDTGMPYLVYDGLGRSRGPAAPWIRDVVRAVLERKYAHICPPEYVEAVVGSFVADPVPLRPPRYLKRAASLAPAVRGAVCKIVVTDRHQIHHVRERGYVEAPARIDRILGEIGQGERFVRVRPREFPEHHVAAVHDAEFVRYLRRICAAVPPARAVYPYVFPLRNRARPPRDLAVRAGYYCIDTFTPLGRNAYQAAKRAVDCALTAAECLLEGDRFAYALVRPPGHHAERRSFGGFCYFNNAAIAAHHLSAHGKVAMLDIDYHHGNGQQDIFHRRADVLTVSIHGHPDFAYPYFSGFEDERGEGDGLGFNLNLPLPEQADGVRHAKAVGKALERIREFDPRFLVVCLGLDTAKADPTGTWTLVARDFDDMGRRIAGLGLPTLVTQEGGYRTRTLGANARAFFDGLLGAHP